MAPLSSEIGRPRLSVPRDQLQLLVESNLPIPDISRAMGVSESTITRRIRQYGFTPRSERFTDISNGELLDIVRDIHSRNPYSRYRMVLANLR